MPGNRLWSPGEQCCARTCRHVCPRAGLLPRTGLPHAALTLRASIERCFRASLVVEVVWGVFFCFFSQSRHFLLCFGQNCEFFPD